MKKNQIYETKIIDNGMEFEGVARIDNMPIFIPYVIKDEVAKIKILKTNKNFAFGKLEELIAPSMKRQKASCESYVQCGGCMALHIDYDETLNMKLNFVKNTFKKQGLDISKINTICGMNYPYGYRNKGQFPVRNIDGINKIGMFAKRSHRLIPIKDCIIQNPRINEVAELAFNNINKCGLKGYIEETGTGDIKNIIVRVGVHTGEVMLVLVVNGIYGQKDSRYDNFVKLITEKDNGICSIVLNYNNKKDNVILGDKNECIYGKEYIMDYIGDVKYKISPSSFFQVNTLQAEVLYNEVKKSLDINEDITLLDLYSGVGTIGIFLSKYVKKVYGVEIVNEAVEMAIQNIRLNNVKNATYIAGDASVELERLRNEGVYFDHVVVDPPRKGLDLDGIETLLKIQPKKICYVSCNAATLARDIKLLESKYELLNVELVDMFPHTPHVECCVLLEIKKDL